MTPRSTRRNLVIAAVVGGVVGALLLAVFWLQKARPDHWFVVLGTRAEIEPMRSGFDADDLQLRSADGAAISNVHLFDFPPMAVTEVVLGARMAPAFRSDVIDVLRGECYAHVRLLESTPHDSLFKVSLGELDAG